MCVTFSLWHYRVLKAANSLRWHSEVISWIQKWTAKPKETANADILVEETSQIKLN